jgi:hypothetical protein
MHELADGRGPGLASERDHVQGQPFGKLELTGWLKSRSRIFQGIVSERALKWKRARPSFILCCGSLLVHGLEKGHLQDCVGYTMGDLGRNERLDVFTKLARSTFVPVETDDHRGHPVARFWERVGAVVVEDRTDRA